MSLSKNKIKYIRSLEGKKHRKEEGVFLAEGPKLVGELLGHFPCRLLVATSEWLEASLVRTVAVQEILVATREELSRASLLKTPQSVLALFEQPSLHVNAEIARRSLCLALDGVQDPGNLGTIVRLADWFGIEHIFCSLNTVDVYSPKTVQATMGGLARVKVGYTDLPALLDSLEGIPVYGTFLDGGNMYDEALSETGLIVMGNEGNGISAEVAARINRRIYIPTFPADRLAAESLNVGVATAVVCAEFRRQAATK
ncbi:MAG: RNA methyltransferase [Bacteroides sp.]|nr:RNA methyltransferase [Bacteroides sp.]